MNTKVFCQYSVVCRHSFSKRKSFTSLGSLFLHVFGLYPLSDEQALDEPAPVVEDPLLPLLRVPLRLDGLLLVPRVHDRVHKLLAHHHAVVDRVATA